MLDAVVIGAGPAGSVTARQLARKGLNVRILEEHAAVGVPVHCSGLVTPRTLEVAGVEQEVVQNTISGATVFHLPSGRSLQLGGDRLHAFVIDRRRFDERLIEQAQQAGADLLLNARFRNIEYINGHARIHLSRHGISEKLDSRLVIGADGSHSALAHQINPELSVKHIVALGGDIRLPREHGNFVHVYLGSPVSPGWFGWFIPVEQGLGRIGVGCSYRTANPHHLLKLMSASSSTLDGMEILRLQGGLIPVAMPRKTYTRNVMLVGDAAGQVKATSGGGIYPSVVAAGLCAETACDALSRGDFSEQALSSYHRSFQSALGSELSKTLALYRFLFQLDQREVAALCDLFSGDEFQRIISTWGDIDYPSEVTRSLIKPRSVLQALFRLPISFWPKFIKLSWEMNRKDWL